MSYQKKSYVEHVAVIVKDIHWHIRFFKEALGQDIRKIQGEPENPQMVWTTGGIQLNQESGYSGSEGYLSHIGIMVEDLEEAIQAAISLGVEPMPKGRGWLRLPEGISLELMQAKGDTVAQALAVKAH